MLIIYKKIERRIDRELGEDKFGFRKSRGTREAVLALGLIIEGRLRKNKSTCMAFVDLKKAFENVDWDNFL